MKKLSKILTFLLLIAAFLLPSCKDDVIPPPPVIQDTTDRYIWRAVYSYGTIADLFVCDTNDIWVSCVTVPMHYDGDTIKLVDLNDPNFAFRILGGYDKSNIYFGGGAFPTPRIPILKKWRDGIVTTYNITNDTGLHVFNILPIAEEQAFVSTVRTNRIYLYNSGNFVQYYLMDTGVTTGKIFRDLQNNVYVFGYSTGYYKLYSYKLINDSLHLLEIDTLSTTNGISGVIVQCGNDLLMIGQTSTGMKIIFWFDGQNWMQYLTTDFDIFKLGGVSKDSLIAVDYSGFLHARVNYRWIKDNVPLSPWGTVFPDITSDMKLHDNKLYCSVNIHNGPSYLFIGKPKN